MKTDVLYNVAEAKSKIIAHRIIKLLTLATFAIFLDLVAQNTVAQDAYVQHIPIANPCNSYPDEFTHSYVTGDGPENEHDINSPSYSPSITSLKSSNTEYLVAAFVYRKDETHRTVGFARSTNAGVSWNLITSATQCSASQSYKLKELRSPKIGDFVCTNLDEPQIISLGGDTLVLVVRGWPDNGSDGSGNKYNEQEHSIPFRSGIFIYVSYDQGVTWGYYNSNNNYVTNTNSNASFGKVEILEPSSTTEIATLEHPRIAFRPGFDPNGYVTWQKKTWTKSGTYLQVSESKIGIAAFRRAGTPRGKLFDPQSTSEAPYYVGELNVSDQHMGPELPSIALSPDGQFWIGYVVPHYSTTSSGSGEQVEIFQGRRSPTADWKLLSGECKIVLEAAPGGGTVEKAVFTFKPPVIVNRDNSKSEITTKRFHGLYDGHRGYFFSYDSSGRDLSNNNNRGDIFMPESGPSIQVGVVDPLSCNNYQVGYLFTSGNSDVITDDVIDGTSTLNFYCSFFKGGGSSVNWVDNMVEVEPSTSSKLVSHIDATNTSCDNCGTGSYFFPVLKYVNYEDSYLNKEVFTGETTLLPRSYFVAAYMFVQRYEAGSSDAETIQEEPNYSTNPDRVWTRYVAAECRTAFAHNNKNFFVMKYDGSNPEIKVSMVRQATKLASTNNILIDQAYWGKQIDVSGSFGNLSYHPIWHHIVENRSEYYLDDNYNGEGIKSNNAECIIIKPFLDDHLANDPEAYPTYFSGDGTGSKQRFISTSLDYSSSTNNYRWSPYVYCNFKNSDGNWIDRPVGASVIANDNATSVTPFLLEGPLGLDESYSISYVNDDGQNFNGSTSIIPISSTTSTTVIPTGIYYANYTSGSNELGALFFSHQRKFVMTGNYVHTVFERDGNVFYSMNRYDKSTTDPDWIKVTPLDESMPNSTTIRSRPSIAVYQQGDSVLDFCGQAAIAAVWKEVDFDEETAIKVSLKLRTREFNLCTGDWFEWSPVYTIHEHTFDAHSTTFGGITNAYHNFQDDSTMVVVAPIVTPYDPDVALKNGPNIEGIQNVRTILVGWTVTWTSPVLSSNSSGIFVDQNTSANKFTYGAYSRTLLRKHTSGTLYSSLDAYNSSWGKYPVLSTCTACIQPNSGFLANKIFEPLPANNNAPLGYPTVVSAENKTRYSNADVNYEQELAYSRFGVDVPSTFSTRKQGIWHKSVKYYRSGANLGLLDITGDASYKDKIGTPINEVAPPSRWGTTATFGHSFDRNPCITMNSSGQIFVSWENLLFTPELPVAKLGGGGTTIGATMRSRIIANNTFYNSGWFGPKRTSNLHTRVSMLIPEMKWEFLLNPSISGFPKSHWVDKDEYDIDADPGIVQLLYWKHKEFSDVSSSFIPVNSLHSNFVYSEGRGLADKVTIGGILYTNNKGKGLWTDQFPNRGVMNFSDQGTNAHLSFSPYSGGPTFVKPLNTSDGLNFNLLNWPQTWPPDWSTNPLAYPFGNDKDNLNEFINPNFMQGTYKGVVVDTFPMKNYRIADFVKDSLMGSFVWGNVRVGPDTSDPTHNRAVLLRLGMRDSGAYNSVGEYMDSVFQTEVFDWYPNTEISYMRGLYLSDSNSLHPGSPFFHPTKSIRFTFELVSGSQIDTIETAIFSPANLKYPIPTRMHIPNGDTLIRDVSLRVRLSITGITIPDSMWQFASEFTEDEYEALEDSTTVAFKRAATPVEFSNGSELLVSSIHPNPASKNQIIRVKFAFPKGYDALISVFDVLGRNIVSPTTISTNGYWQEHAVLDRLPVGTYYLTISVAAERKVLPFVVSN